jgi:hypothetical protein
MSGAVLYDSLCTNHFIESAGPGNVSASILELVPEESWGRTPQSQPACTGHPEQNLPRQAIVRCGRTPEPKQSSMEAILRVLIRAHQTGGPRVASVHDCRSNRE